MRGSSASFAAEGTSGRITDLPPQPISKKRHPEMIITMILLRAGGAF
jgi:hypothetical protein